MDNNLLPRTFIRGRHANYTRENTRIYRLCCILPCPPAVATLSCEARLSLCCAQFSLNVDAEAHRYIFIYLPCCCMQPSALLTSVTTIGRQLTSFMYYSLVHVTCVLYGNFTWTPAAIMLCRVKLGTYDLELAIDTLSIMLLSQTWNLRQNTSSAYMSSWWVKLRTCREVVYGWATRTRATEEKLLQHREGPVNDLFSFLNME